jgi:hypothetical protein
VRGIFGREVRETVIFAGFDEAGYGPRLGPLVVSWTAFRVPDALVPPAAARSPKRPSAPTLCLWKALKAGVRKTPNGAATKVWVADSKAVKPRKDGMALLELGALSFLELGPLPTNLGAVLTAVGLDASRYGVGPWYDGLDAVKVPAFAWAGEIATRALRVRTACADTGISFVGAQSCVLPEWEFNAGLALPAPVLRDDPELADSNKADVMQREAFSPLLRELRRRFPGEEIDIIADKHGGRNFYGPLIERNFPGAEIVALAEGEGCSAYRVRTAEGPFSIRFEPEADARHFCVALASMICKYLRELFMERLNSWFLERVDRELKPTAGYPGDAERFIAAIEPSLPKLGIQRELLVRMR